MKAFWAICSALLLSGCAATAETQVHRGHKGVHISCSGLGASWERCYSSAEVACAGRGYKVLGQSTQHGEDQEAGILGINPAGLTTRKLLVKCD